MFLVIGAIIGTLALFASETFSLGISALIILSVTMILGVFSPEAFPNVAEGLSGFANTATITILCMFILSAGIQQTGILQKLSHHFGKATKKSFTKTLLFLALIVVPSSALVSNTAVVAIMIPFLLEISRKNKIAATKLMIPLSFFSMTAGMLTLIGSSTNILSNSLMVEITPETESLGIFSITLIGLLGAVICILYFLTIGKWLLPNRKSEQENLALPDFFLEILIEKDNPFIGKSIEQSQFGDHYGVYILNIAHGGRNYTANIKEKTIQEGDIYLVKMQENSLTHLLKQTGIRILSNFDEYERHRSFEHGKIVKAVFISNMFLNMKMKWVDFLEHFGVTPIGLNHTGKITSRLKEMFLQAGQIFLLHMTSRRFEKFKHSDQFLFLDTVEEKFQTQKTLPTLIIMALVIIIPAFTNVPIVVTALLGVVAMILTRCVQPDSIFENVNWDIIFLIAGLVPLGIAVQKSGLGELIAQQIVSIAYDLPTLGVLLLFYGFTTIMTETISNTAAVVLIIPIALSTATALGINPHAIVIVIMFAGSMSMLSPFGYQTNALIYRAANYRFSDFARVGLPPNIILMFSTCWATYHLFA